MLLGVFAGKDDPAAASAQQELNAVHAGRVRAIGCMDRPDIFTSQEGIRFGVYGFACAQARARWQMSAGARLIDAMRLAGCRAVIAIANGIVMFVQ